MVVNNLPNQIFDNNLAIFINSIKSGVWGKFSEEQMLCFEYAIINGMEPELVGMVAKVCSYKNPDEKITKLLLEIASENIDKPIDEIKKILSIAEVGIRQYPIAKQEEQITNDTNTIIELLTRHGDLGRICFAKKAGIEHCLRSGLTLTETHFMALSIPNNYQAYNLMKQEAFIKRHGNN